MYLLGNDKGYLWHPSVLSLGSYVYFRQSLYHSDRKENVDHAFDDLRHLADRRIEGNNVLDVWAATHEAVELCRAGEGPVLLVARTFRMGGHATHDEAEARDLFPQETFDHWGRRDPIGLYEAYLARTGVDAATLERVEAEVTVEIDRAAHEALESRRRNMPPPESALEKQPDAEPLRDSLIRAAHAEARSC